MVDLTLFATCSAAAKHEAARAGLFAASEEWLAAGEEVGVGLVVVEDRGDCWVLGYVEVVVEWGVV